MQHEDTNTQKLITFCTETGLQEVTPATGVLVEVGAGKALVPTSGLQDLPGLLSAADLDPAEV